MTQQRVNALTAPYSDSLQTMFEAIMPKGMPPLNIFRTVGNNERVLSRMVGGNLLDRGSISAQEREIAILRTCAVCGAEYEWGVHVAGFAARVGLSSEQVHNTADKEIDESLWSEAQRLILELVSSLHESSTVDETLWSRLKQHYSDEQLIELVMLVGAYHSVSFIANALQLEREPFAPTFP